MALKTDENTTKWDNIRVMVYILHAKWNCYERFRQTLMSTAGMAVAEATQDMFWGVGAAPNLVQQTKPGKFLGENQLGKVLHRIRTQVDQLTPINNSSHDYIVLDMPAPPSELLSTIDTSSSPPSSPVKVTRVHVPPPPPLTQATTRLPPEIISYLRFSYHWLIVNRQRPEMIIVYFPGTRTQFNICLNILFSHVITSTSTTSQEKDHQETRSEIYSGSLSP